MLGDFEKSGFLSIRVWGANSYSYSATPGLELDDSLFWLDPFNLELDGSLFGLDACGSVSDGCGSASEGSVCLLQGLRAKSE
jgi:hypothetical protein